MSTDQARLAARRRIYAELVTASIRAVAPEVTEAFAAIPREAFVGPGPWDMFAGGQRVHTPDNDPIHLYQDVVVRLRGHINNGQPSLHAMCLAALTLAPGETVIHVGAGTGYYTAMLAWLVQHSGAVHAYEVDVELATRARTNLADQPQVVVHHQSAVGTALPSADAIYVSAGATHPVSSWLHALRVGGRLLFPLTPDGAGAMLLITRRATGAFDARFVCSAVFIPCLGARDEATGEGLGHAFARGDMEQVRSLVIGDVPDETVWFAGKGWWLSTRPAK